ncbi:MAG: hypothetical protein RL100_479 [Actinomycetota bacterium]|jgi:fucose permease
MTKTPRTGLWFAGASAIFFTRAFLFSSWVSRGPEVQAALDINTAQMGMLSMVYPAGGLAGILFASWLVQRFGSTAVNTGGYLLATVGFFSLGQAVDAGNVILAAASLFAVGLPLAISDFLGNYEATNVDRISKHSLFPVIHGSFGIGMLSASAFASYLISQKVSLSSSFLMIAIFIAVISIVAGYAFPKKSEVQQAASQKAEARSQSIRVWFEKRTLVIALIGFSFIMAEMASGIWVPIALTKIGFSAAEAAGSIGVMWIVITIARLLGGYVLDAIGRYRVVLLSAVFTVVGMAIFIANDQLHLPYLGLVIWGLGMALGFPMSVLSLSDDPAMSAARVNMIITVVYISSITVGPVLGSVGQAFGLLVAFAIPLALNLLSVVLSPVTKPATSR